MKSPDKDERSRKHSLPDIAKLRSLTVKEVNELAGILKNEYGIEPAAAAPLIGPATSNTTDEKTIKNYFILSILSSIIARASRCGGYVDPYLFETGHFENRAEYEKLMHNIKLVKR